MLTYEQLKRNPRKFVALTGLTVAEFEKVLPAYTRAYQRRFPGTQTMTGQPRQRQAGGGRKATWASMEQKLLFVLVFQKAYPLQVLLGEVFDLSQSQATRWIHRLLPVLKETLDGLGVWPEREPTRFARHEHQQAEALDLIIDGTERRRQRPKSPEKQALHYSGKKKTHNDKNLVIVNAHTQRVGYLSRTYPGKAHDKAIADHEAIVYPRTAQLHKDSGFQGDEPRVRPTYQPKKNRATAN